MSWIFYCLFYSKKTQIILHCACHVEKPKLKFYSCNQCQYKSTKEDWLDDHVEEKHGDLEAKYVIIFMFFISFIPQFCVFVILAFI